MKEWRLFSSCFVIRYQSLGENDLSAFYLEVRESTFLEIIWLTAEAYGVIFHKTVILISANRASNLKQKVDQNKGYTFLVTCKTRITKEHWNYVFKFSIIRRKYGITGNKKICRAVTFGIRRMSCCLHIFICQLISHLDVLL
jgi:hypothetical protein